MMRPSCKENKFLLFFMLVLLLQGFTAAFGDVKPSNEENFGKTVTFEFHFKDDHIVLPNDTPYPLPEYRMTHVAHVVIRHKDGLLTVPKIINVGEERVSRSTDATNVMRVSADTPLSWIGDYSVTIPSDSEFGILCSRERFTYHPTSPHVIGYLEGTNEFFIRWYSASEISTENSLEIEPFESEEIHFQERINTLYTYPAEGYSDWMNSINISLEFEGDQGKTPWSIIVKDTRFVVANGYQEPILSAGGGDNEKTLSWFRFNSTFSVYVRDFQQGLELYRMPNNDRGKIFPFPPADELVNILVEAAKEKGSLVGNPMRFKLEGDKVVFVGFTY